MTKLIVGLGNPGEKYEFTRHNIGRMTVAHFAKTYFPSSVFETHSRFSSLALKGKLNGDTVICALPETFMNNSGKAVKALSLFYKIPPSCILVASDEVQIPLGQIRLCEKGGGGGHNGLTSVIAHLGTEEFPRLRIGIKPLRAFRIPLDKFVLKHFSKIEQQKINFIIQTAVKAIEEYAREGITSTMNKFNGAK